jgi:hypothetical protein
MAASFDMECALPGCSYTHVCCVVLEGKRIERGTYTIGAHKTPLAEQRKMTLIPHAYFHLLLLIGKKEEITHANANPTKVAA